MRSWLFIALSACGHSGGASDAAPTDATLTVTTHGQGMVVSTPAGIQCGACAVPMGGCPDPQSATVCSFDFAVGTAITLKLIDQQIYAGVGCTATPATQVTPHGLTCDFTLARPTSVVIDGFEAVR